MDSAKASLVLGNKLFPWLLLVVSGGEEKQPESGDWVCKGLATLSKARSAATSLAGGGGGRLRRLRSASASLCWLVDTKCACQAICNSGELNIVGRSTPRGRTLSPEGARESGPPSGSPAAELGLKTAGGRSMKGPEGGKLGKRGKGGAKGRGNGEGERDMDAGLPG